MVVVEQIQERIGEGGASEEARLRRQLLELRLRYELDEIDETQYERDSAAVIARLNELREEESEGEESETVT